MTVDDPLDPPDYDPLGQEIHGEVLQPGDGGYDEAREIWNAMIDREPAVIVRPTGAADVITAVEFAADQNLPIAVKGGGHDYDEVIAWTESVHETVAPYSSGDVYVNLLSRDEDDRIPRRTARITTDSPN